jgi:hypothetical protein
LKQINFSQYWDDCFDKKSEYYLKYLDLLASVDEEERGTDIENGYEVHHIIPRSYFEKIGIKVDNSKNNLIKFTPSEHYMAHYYMSKCAKPIIKHSMIYALYLMTQTATTRKCDFSAEQFAKFYEEVKLDFIKCQKVNTNLRNLTQEQRHKNFIKAMKSRSENMDYRKYLSDRMKGNKINEGNLRYSLEEINLMTSMHNIGYTLKEIRKYFLISSVFLRKQVESAKKKWGKDKVVEFIELPERTGDKYLYDKETDNILTMQEVMQKENISDYILRKKLKADNYKYCLIEYVSISDIVDFLLPHYKKDPFIIDRLRTILDLMVKYNED